MDEGLSKAVLKVFVELYDAGLIYKDKRLVNWDPKLKTAISDLEVQQVESKGQVWHIKYPIEDSGEFIVVATTRPETMLGDVAVAVHPENQRLKHLIGKTTILPLVGDLQWSDAALGWVAHWSFEARGRRHLWSVSGVNYDEAFRNAVRGAMRVLSGNGGPL